jgi:hypothetical protein
MIDFNCDVKKIVYASLDEKRPIVVVIFEGRHTHPPWPEEKAVQEAKVDLQKCLEAFGIYGATAEKLDNGMHGLVSLVRRTIILFSHYFFYDLSAPSTIALLGMPLSAKHNSYRNKRFLQDGIRTEKQKEAPTGFQWNGQ